MTDINEKLEQLEKDDVTKGERYFSRKFTSCYNTVRRSLVLIKQAKSPIYEGGSRKEQPDGSFKIKKGNLVKEAELSNRDAVTKTLEVLQKAITDLE